ncbi:hypothetical protein CYY_001365 [Polysphondylium violaceum]|uniref:Uncharacterized protein n=1 Tax=Polysphondylium violaceum TaxID=133409 RepID=A0A8J4Q264_9MYCE|nr:hypothetical protein CYY_001365 [Polysphondylium violaceum]
MHQMLLSLVNQLQLDYLVQVGYLLPIYPHKVRPVGTGAPPYTATESEGCSIVTITAMDAYSTKSFEELRLEDVLYKKDKIYKTGATTTTSPFSTAFGGASTPLDGTSSPFGTSSTTSSPFGGASTTSSFSRASNGPNHINIIINKCTNFNWNIWLIINYTKHFW